MANPTPYERTYSFTDYQAGNPSAPLPGIQVDNELENIENSLGEAIDAIKDVRRSDGALKNGIVTVDSLDATVAAGVGTGALASAAAAAASADAASDSAVAAAASATAAAGSATSASGYAGDALTSRNEAATEKTLAQTARTGAQTARDYAYQWSSAAEGVDVNDGVNPVNKSAYHWAQVALAAATATIPDGSITTIKLANLAVTTGKIADGAFSADTTGRAKMADGFVTAAKLDPAAPVVRSDTAQSFTDAQKGQARANIGGGVLTGFRDKIINGSGAISQRVYTTVADDTYWCDRHYVLTQTATITPTILTDVANGLPFMMRLSQSQATAQRMGNAQILEAAVSKPLRGDTVTFGGRMRCSSAQTISYAVLEWTGTADAVTSDVVSNWTSTTYTPGNFFLASNLVVAASGSVALTANTLTDWSITASISGSCNNIIVLYWTSETVAQNVTLDMAWGLVEGDATAELYPYEARHPRYETELCQYYAQWVYLNIGWDAAALESINIPYPLPVPMRIKPTVGVNVNDPARTQVSTNANAGNFQVQNNAMVSTYAQSAAAGPVGIFGYRALLDAEL